MKRTRASRIESRSSPIQAQESIEEPSSKELFQQLLWKIDSVREDNKTLKQEIHKLVRYHSTFEQKQDRRIEELVQDKRIHQSTISALIQQLQTVTGELQTAQQNNSSRSPTTPAIHHHASLDYYQQPHNGQQIYPIIYN